MKTYTKLSTTSFKVSETKTLESNIEALKQLEAMASQLSAIKKIIAQAKQLKENVIQTVEWYNTRVDILNEAKENCWLSYKRLEKVILDKEFVLEELDVESFPKIDIKKDEN